MFNPGSNANQVSELRLVNPSSATADVTIMGIDDIGESPGEGVDVTVPAESALTFTAQQRESAQGVDGSIGDGRGKWELAVASDRPIIAMSLLRSPTGHLTNLSTVAPRPPTSDDAIPAPPVASMHDLGIQPTMFTTSTK